MVLPADDIAARSYVDSLRQRNFDELEKHLDPTTAVPNIRGLFEWMATLFPEGQPRSAKLVGVRLMHGPDSTMTALTYEYEFPEKWLLAYVTLRRVGADSLIAGIHVQPLSDSLENLNRFSLRGKNLLKYLLVGSAIAIPIFSLYALVSCIRTKLERRKWLWILFIVVGFGSLSVDLTTGQWHATPLAFQLFSASCFASPYGPWVVSVSVPLGAFIFLLLRKQLSQSASEYSFDGKSSDVVAKPTAVPHTEN